MKESIFEYSAKANNGSEKNFADYTGKALLIVNTASKCGFTPQYKGLQELYDNYKDKGLVVIGFPCDQFAHQEPGSDSDIAEFCSVNFGVNFPLMSKINVNGKDTHPIYEFLKKKAPGAIGNSIKWNFTKFLISRDGKSVKRFDSKTAPADITADIERVLAE